MTASVSVEIDESNSQTAAPLQDRAGTPSAAEPEAPDDLDRLSKDIVFELLSNGRRRMVLTYLAEVTKTTTLSDLAEHIASIENDKPEAALSSSERKRVYVALYQCHLPKLDDANVIDHNQARGTVELRPEADQLFRYISVDLAATNPTDTWLRQLLSAPLRALGNRVLG